MEIDAFSLSGTSLNESEIEAVLQCRNVEEMIYKLRLFRCRILEDIHGRQQALDRLDYIIERLKKENTQQ